MLLDVLKEIYLYGREYENSKVFLAGGYCNLVYDKEEIMW